MKVLSLFLFLQQFTPIFADEQNSTDPVRAFNGAKFSKLTLPIKFTSEYDYYTVMGTLDGKWEHSQRPYRLLQASVNADSGLSKVGLFATDATEDGFTLLTEFEGPNFEGADQAMYYKGKYYFIFGSGDLWISDGTPEGTSILKEIIPDGVTWPGAFDANERFTIFKDKIYFVLDEDGYSSWEAIKTHQLWKSDGTKEGTVMVEEWTGGEVQELSNFDEKYLLLSVRDQDTLFATDGVNPIKELTADAENIVLNPITVPSVNGKAIFRADDGIWSTQGTLSTTSRFSTLPADRGFGNFSYFGKIFFPIEDFWFTTDGTQDGTKPINISNPMEGIEYRSFQQDTGISGYGVLSAFNGTTYILDELPNGLPSIFSTGSDEGDPAYMYSTDGTGSGTKLVKKFENFKLRGAPVLENKRQLLASSTEIWITDGTFDGTKKVFEKVESNDYLWKGLGVFCDGSILLDIGDKELYRVEIEGAEGCQEDSEDDDNLGLIIGLSVGGVVFICLIAGVVFYCIKRKSNANQSNQKSEEVGELPQPPTEIPQGTDKSDEVSPVPQPPTETPQAIGDEAVVSEIRIEEETMSDGKVKTTKTTTFADGTIQRNITFR